MRTLGETARQEGMPAEFIEDLDGTLAAARALLAALLVLSRLQASGILKGDGVHDTTTQMHAAIAQAEAAGIAAEE
jgi:hypothetical protein